MEASESASLSKGKLRQFIVAVIVNLVSLSYGIGCGWASPIIPQLRSSHPPVGDTPMSEDQISWITSLLPIGGLLTIPFCGILSESIGRKNFALLTGLPYVFASLLIIFGQNYMTVLAARLFIGIAGALTFFIVPLYVSEIASEDIRGFLGSLLLFSFNVGILFAYIAGAFLSYRLFAILSLLIAVIFLITFALMPETPVYLVRRKREVQARKSLMFFRGNDQTLVQHQVTKLRSQTNTSDKSSVTMKFRELFSDRATRKGLLICIVLIGAQQLSGIFAMISYTETIFKRAGSSLSAVTASIIIGIIQILGSCASTMLIERAGRRLLTLTSCLGTTLSHAFVSLFFYLQQSEYNVSSIWWLPLVGLSSYIITYCLGIGPVPFVVISEVFSQDISSFASTACFVFYFIIGFIAIRLFDLAMQFFGAAGCFLMLAAFCAASFAVCYWLIPETKGRKREDIICELAGIDQARCKGTNVTEKCAEGNALINIDRVQGF